MRFLFDSDHATFLQRGSGTEFDRILERMTSRPPADFGFSVAGFHEQLLGAHELIQQSRTPTRLASAYALLSRLMAFYADVAVLPVTEPVAGRYLALKLQVRQVKAMDLRIAATALVNGLTVLTRDARDFCRVPGLAFEDRTAPLPPPGAP